MPGSMVVPPCSLGGDLRIVITQQWLKEGLGVRGRAVQSPICLPGKARFPRGSGISSWASDNLTNTYYVLGPLSLQSIK